MAAATVMMMVNKRKVSLTSGTKAIPRYTVQGTVSVVDLTKRTFTLDPVSPHVFEGKDVDGTSIKSVIFVNAVDKVGKIVECGKPFYIPHGIDLGAIIALKNGRDKVEISTSLEEDGKGCIVIENLKTV